MSTSALRFALVLGTSTSFLAAQSAWKEPSTMLLDPTWGELGACREVHGGHVFGTLGVDAVLLYESGPVATMQPEVYRAPVRLNVAANDVAVYPRYPAAPDRIFVAGPEGLKRFSWNGAQFVDDAPVVPNSPWIGALVVGVADLEGQGALDLYGLDATRTKVILCRGANVPLSGVVPFGEPIESVLPVQWNGTGFQELAVRTAQTLQIINYQSALLATFAVAPGSAPCQVVDIPGSTRQAVIVPTGSGAGESLNVFGLEGLIQVLPLPWQGVAGLGVGDLDLDGDSDFVLSHRAGPTLELFEGGLSEGLLHFAPNAIVSAIHVENWLDVLANQTTPGVTDFDHDGDPDVLFPPVGTARVDLYGNGHVDEELYLCHPQVGAMTLEPAGGAFHITMEVPPGAAEGGWTDIEVIVWRQPRFDHLVDSAAFLPPSYHSFEGLSEFTFSLQTPHFEWFEDLYHLEVRLVQREAGVKLAQGPGMIAAVGLQQPLMALGELEGIVGHGQIYGITFPVPPQFEYPGEPLEIEPIPVGGTADPRDEGHGIEYVGGTWGGGSGCLPDLPDFQSGLVPSF
jgi:hypothetical protein